MISEKERDPKDEEDSKNVFAVVPETIDLQPKKGTYIQFRAYSQNIGKIIEQFVCNSVI